MPLRHFLITADVPSDLEPTGEFRAADMNVDSCILDSGGIHLAPGGAPSGIRTSGPRIILRPVWQWPQWIKPGCWLAMEENGEWWLYPAEPKLGKATWASTTSAGATLMANLKFTPPPCTDWRQSLRQKPL